jgi:glycosyltransferase involved in cell wall biosynthesis
MKRTLLFCFIGVLICFFGILIMANIEIFIHYNTNLIKSIFTISFDILFIYFIFNLIYIQPKIKLLKTVQYEPIISPELTVVLTAYNDELSIRDAVLDFKNHPKVKRVIVVSNNSKDRTIQFAEEAGAIAYNEEKQGYGACVHRALTEGAKFEDTELTLLCEGDMTFKAYDIDKFLAYLPHADIVSGTRIVDQLRNKETQLTNFMFYGNFFVGKLLELKHISVGTFTDVGTTYKLCRNEILRDLLPKLDNSVNLEFNPYFLDRALTSKYLVVECPVTFHPRVGVSKGGNINNYVAFKLGMRMIWGILWKW